VPSRSWLASTSAIDRSSAIAASALTRPSSTKAGISRNETTCCGGSVKAASGPMWTRVITVPITELITTGEKAPRP
jgi:hypothetical protein